MSERGANFGSVLVALPSFFDERGQLDDKSLDHLVDYLLNSSVRGLALLTEAGEDAVLSPEERRHLIERVGRRVRGKKELVVGISAVSTREAIDLARHAEGQGAAAILLATDRVPGLGYRELYRHLDRVARATELPVLMVVRSGNAADGLAAEELATLGQHPRLAGVWLPEPTGRAPKRSSGEGGPIPGGPGPVHRRIETWAKRLESRGGEIYGGCALSFLGAAKSGATGVICGLSMLATDLSVRMMGAVRRADVDEARSIEKKTAPAVDLLGPPRSAEELDGVKRLAARIARRSLEGSGLPLVVPFPLIKEGLRLQGHPIKSIVRPPFEQVGPEQIERLKSVMRGSGLIS